MTKTEERLQLICLLLLSFIAAAFALYWLKPIMVPFILALFIHLVITEAADLQRRYLKIPNTLALASTILAGILLLTIFGLLITGSIGRIIDNGESYKNQIEELIEHSAEKFPIEENNPEIREMLDRVLENAGDQLGGIISSTMQALTNIFSKGLLVFIFLLFLFLGKTKDKAPKGPVWNQAKSKIKRYISSKLLVSLAQGVLVGMVLSALKIDFALMFGLFAFILNFIPNIGPIVATLLPLPVVITSPELSLIAGILAIGIPGAIMFVIGNVVEPKIVGGLLNLHPITILMALIFWGMLWGIVGMFLAVPLTAVLVLILEEIEITRPIANLLTIRQKE